MIAKKVKAGAIKTRTSEGNICKTYAFIVTENDVKMFVVERIFLMTIKEFEGDFTTYKPLRYFKDMVLLKQQMVFFTESFEKIINIYNVLKYE